MVKMVKMVKMVNHMRIKMSWLLLILFSLSILLLLFLSACSVKPAVICSKPYILNGQQCCLDTNANNICDVDEGLIVHSANRTESADCPKQDCSLCPARVVEKYVQNKSKVYICEKTLEQVSNPDDCVVHAQNKFEGYQPVETNENGTVIEVFTVRPACRESFNSAEFHFKLGSASPSVVLQVKESPEGPWRDVFTQTSGTTEKYIYGVFCDTQCTSSADFFLPPGKVYLFRLKVDYKKLYGVYQFSNEQLVDMTVDGSFATKLC